MFYCEEVLFWLPNFPLWKEAAEEDEFGRSWKNIQCHDK